MMNKLNNHLIPEYILFAELIIRDTIKNFNYIDLFISTDLKINDANIIESDIKGENVIIHAIDKIIMP